MPGNGLNVVCDGVGIIFFHSLRNLRSFVGFQSSPRAARKRCYDACQLFCAVLLVQRSKDIEPATKFFLHSEADTTICIPSYAGNSGTIMPLSSVWDPKSGLKYEPL